MNTVLDDNKTLCLANSERIKLPSTLHMMFEVQDLKVASPATVSRCGMVYMEQIHIGVLSLIKSWKITVLDKILSKASSKKVISIIEANIEVMINYVHLECSEKIATTSAQLISSFLNLYYAKLLSSSEPESLTGDDDFMNCLVLWCIVWSVGANIHDKSRKKFQEYLRARFNTTIPSKYNLLLSDPYGVYIDILTKDIKLWSSITPNFEFNADSSYFSILVPTVDTIRYTYILDKLLSINQHVLFCSETGTGKSTIINSYLSNPSIIFNAVQNSRSQYLSSINNNTSNLTNSQMSPSATVPTSAAQSPSAGNQITAKPNAFDQANAKFEQKFISYNFGYSAQTIPSNLKDIFEGKLEKKRKTLLGPPSGKKMFFFIDDINMPVLETYGAQPVNELLRQVIDSNGYYDTQKLFFKNISDVVFVGACCPPGMLFLSILIHI